MDRNDLENLISAFKVEFDNLATKMKGACEELLSVDEEKAASHPDGYYLPGDNGNFFSAWVSPPCTWTSHRCDNVTLNVGSVCETKEEKARVEAQKEAYKKMILAIHEENLRNGFVVDLETNDQDICYFGINRELNLISISTIGPILTVNPRECFGTESGHQLKGLLGAELIRLAKGWPNGK